MWCWPGKVSRLTFDRLCSTEFDTTLQGNEIVGLYIALSGDEEKLDRNQRKALECLRAILYENLSVEELEDIRSSYATRLDERCF